MKQPILRSRTNSGLFHIAAMTSWINIKWNKFRTVKGTWWCTIYSCFRYHILYNRQCSSAVNIKSISLLDCLLLLSQGWLSYEIIHSVICSVCERDNQWRRQTQEVGGAEVRGSGGRSPPAGSRGRSPVGVWGQSSQKLTLIHKFIVAKSRYFHYNLRNSTSRGLEVFRVIDEWFTTQIAWPHWSYCLNIRPSDFTV